MTNKLFYGLLLSAALLLFACGSDDTATGGGGDNSEWIIPSSEVFDGGPGQDGIPSVDSPNFSPVSDIDFLSDSELVVGVLDGDVAKAYPHIILDWHEIVNDQVGATNVAVTYCPLTGTALGWNRMVNGQLVTFGVSGKLYNTNLMPFDRTTESYWTQLGLECVNGDWINSKVDFVPVIEMSWGAWKAAFPNSLVMNTDTGHSRNYGVYPYGDYRTNNQNIIFPVSPFDNRQPSKERVLGVISEETNRSYSIDLFSQDAVITDTLDNSELIVIGSKLQNFIVAYENNLGLTEVTYVSDSLPVVAASAQGDMITIDGRIVEGPNAGQSLVTTRSWIGYWISFGAFYPGIEIFE